MLIRQNVALSDLTTMKIGGTAKIVIEATTLHGILDALQLAQMATLSYRVLGSGSNVIACDKGFNGVIVLNKINEFRVLEQSEHKNRVRVRAGAGEILDTIVARTVEMGLSGLEALSGIPGTIGADPVQNAGAYGQEIGDHLELVQAIDTQTMRMTQLTKSQCEFAYRDSVFKHNDRRYIITAVTLLLTRTNPEPPFYTTLADHFTDRGIAEYTPKMVRDAVLLIRRNKLPNPLLLPNVGSFFKNPVIDTPFADALKEQNRDITLYPAGSNKAKLSAGWLIENAGFRGYSKGPLQVHRDNALVIVNSGNADHANLIEFRDLIVQGVERRFGVQLHQEPEEL